jgi:hypothetical protein
MRRIYPLLAIVGGVAIVGFLARGGPASSVRQEEAPLPTPVPPALSTFQYQGVASCTSVACHHGNGPKGSKGSEYTTWIAHNDPHARAYTVLFDQQSLTIEKNLKGLKELRQAQPHKNVLCLNCHVHPDLEKTDRNERFSHADGVGCESCHGPAEKWLSVHYTGEKSADELHALGMTDTKNLLTRAQMCVKCHVGWQESDVNHDLIAAGHPRLRFEYGAYLANYPARHWRTVDDQAGAWLLGQVVSAKAAVDLLKYRADPKNAKPWPEFAEYGCFSCHHDLRDQAWRRKPGAGALSWGTWYFSQLPIVTGAFADRQPLGKLAETMAKTYPDQKQVMTEAISVSKILGNWAVRLERESRDEKSLEKLLAVLVKEHPSDGGPDWDRAAQRYLGIAAIYNALGDLDGHYRRDAALKAAIRGLADRLGDAFPKEPSVKYDSPRDFQPDLLQQDLKRLRGQLQRHGVD